jgi:hypothetical protein
MDDRVGKDPVVNSFKLFGKQKSAQQGSSTTMFSPPAAAASTNNSSSSSSSTTVTRRKGVEASRVRELVLPSDQTTPVYECDNCHTDISRSVRIRCGTYVLFLMLLLVLVPVAGVVSQ